MIELLNKFKELFHQEEINKEYLCNQVQNYNNFGHKGIKDPVALYEVCIAKL